jgi:molybdenum cofactor synthesis domain-containing protein
MKPITIRLGILTVSDKGAAGERQDTSGAAIREVLASLDVSVERYEVVADEVEAIASVLRRWADEDKLDAIFTTGGTGFDPRDVTPEATLAVVDRPTPGLAEAMRLEGLKHTPNAMLSRATAGLRGKTIIVNLPGSERAVRESLACLTPVLEHAVRTARGRYGDHV